MSDLFDWAFSECQRYGSALREWCWPFKDDPTYLWDTSDSMEILWPSVEEMGYPTFRFVGRRVAQKLYDRISTSRRRVLVMGGKGSGKSFLVAAVCNHLQQSGRLRVMFLDARSLVQNPLLTLWRSLLLAFYGDEGKTAEIQSIRDLGILEVWSYSQELVIVVDDWESLETSEGDTQDRKNAKVAAQELILRLEENAPRQFLVQVSSDNMYSRERLEREDNLKKRIRLNKDKFLVDGPFHAGELATWMRLSSLPRELKVSGVVGYLTGGMPRLLEVFEQTGGDEASFKSEISQPLIHKLWSEFLANLTTQEELNAALRLITDGVQGALLTGKVKLTCFYTDSDGKYRLFSPYLAREARSLWIQRWEQVVDAGMLVEPDVILEDLLSVEVLSIELMRLQKAVFWAEDWSSFEHVVEYAAGMEAPDKFSHEQLLDGVLLVPAASNDKAADAVLLIKVAGDVLRLDAIQITVANWKLRSRKQEVAPAWKRALENGGFDMRERVTRLEDRYYCVIPESVKPEDLPGDDRPVILRRFRDIHDKLSFVDTKPIA